MFFDNVEGEVEQGQITLYVYIPELFILSYRLTLEYCSSFTILLLTAQEMSQSARSGYFV